MSRGGLRLTGEFTVGLKGSNNGLSLVVKGTGDRFLLEMCSSFRRFSMSKMGRCSKDFLLLVAWAGAEESLIGLDMDHDVMYSAEVRDWKRFSTRYYSAVPWTPVGESALQQTPAISDNFIIAVIVSSCCYCRRG